MVNYILSSGKLRAVKIINFATPFIKNTSIFKQFKDTKKQLNFAIKRLPIFLVHTSYLL